MTRKIPKSFTPIAMILLWKLANKKLLFIHDNVCNNCGCVCVHGCVVFNRIHLCKYHSRYILENHSVVTSTPVLKGINHTMDIENALA